MAAPAVPYRPSRNHIVIGTSNEIEKKYFRLTAVSLLYFTVVNTWVTFLPSNYLQAPDPATVRPLHVLRDSLALMKNKYKVRNFLDSF